MQQNLETITVDPWLAKVIEENAKKRGMTPAVYLAVAVSHYKQNIAEEDDKSCQELPWPFC